MQQNTFVTANLCIIVRDCIKMADADTDNCLLHTHKSRIISSLKHHIISMGKSCKKYLVMFWDIQRGTSLWCAMLF